MNFQRYQTGAILLEAATRSIPANGAEGVTDQLRLQNPRKTPILIDEIRFNVSPGASTVAVRHVAGDLRVDLRLGRTPLTNGFVPIWNLCLGVNQSFGAGIASVPDQGGDFARAPSLYTWHLPRPLYIPANDHLDVTVQNIAVHFDTSKTCRVVYAGRVIDPKAPVPDVIDVPWATAFVGTANAAGTDATEQTREHHLNNPFKVPLRVQRFIGRISQVNGSRADAASAAAVNAALQYVTIRMVDSQGKVVIRDPTPFSHVFSIKDRAWTVNALLPAHGFYIAYFTEDYSPLAGNALQVYLSMIGHRQVRLKELYLRGT